MKKLFLNPKLDLNKKIEEQRKKRKIQLLMDYIILSLSLIILILIINL